MHSRPLMQPNMYCQLVWLLQMLWSLGSCLLPFSSSTHAYSLKSTAFCCFEKCLKRLISGAEEMNLLN
jgi:hypothetical protein